jgi:hypothetical protein
MEFFLLEELDYTAPAAEADGLISRSGEVALGPGSTLHNLSASAAAIVFEGDSGYGANTGQSAHDLADIIIS